MSSDPDASFPLPSLCRDCLAEFAGADGSACPRCGSLRCARHAELDRLAIAHMDCDAFFASVEKRDDPALADRPVLVGGRHRGVVMAACYVARRYGVHSAMPMFKALRACPDAVVIRPDLARYQAVSREIRAVLRDATPLVEPISIDEAFLDLSGTERLHGHGPAATLAGLAARIEREVGITVSTGLSYNKFLAKIASDRDKPGGFSVIGRGEARAFLADKPVGLLWGVGRALQRRLADDGITVIGQLQARPEAELVARYGVIGRRLARFSRGEDERAVDPEAAVKSISSETTFDDDIADAARLDEILWPLCETVSARLKRSGLAARGVALKLKTADFRIRTRTRRLAAPTQLAEVIYRTARTLLERETDGTRFRLLGVGADGICGSDEADLPDLFDLESGGSGQLARVEHAIDEVREKFGRAAIAKGRGLGARARQAKEQRSRR